MSILLAEFGLMYLPDQWLLRTATFKVLECACSPATYFLIQKGGFGCLRLGHWCVEGGQGYRV